MVTIDNYTFQTTLKSAPYTALLNNHDISLHRHFFWEITYVINGSVTNYVNGTPIICDSLSKIIIMKPNDTHRIVNNVNVPNQANKHRDIYVQDDRMKYICDTISPTLYDEISQTPVVIDTSYENLESLEYTLKMFLITEPYTNIQPDIYDQLHHTVICQILGMFLKTKLKKEKDMPEWAEDFLSNMKNEEVLTLPVNEILKKYPYSHGYLCREFKKLTGKSMVQYLNESRIHYSTILLLNNSLSILDIAMLLNYNSQSAFINAFKKIYNMPPSAWRKKLTTKQQNPTVSR